MTSKTRQSFVSLQGGKRVGATILSLIVTIIAIVFICFLAWFVTRFVASRGNTGIKNGNIRVIEKIVISRDSCIMLVKIVDKVLLVGVTPQGMTTLKEFDADMVTLAEEPPKAESFAQALRQAIDDALPDGAVKKAVGKVEKFIKKKGNTNEKA